MCTGMAEARNEPSGAFVAATASMATASQPFSSGGSSSRRGDVVEVPSGVLGDPEKA